MGGACINFAIRWIKLDVSVMIPNPVSEVHISVKYFHADEVCMFSIGTPEEVVERI